MNTELFVSFGGWPGLSIAACALFLMVCAEVAAHWEQVK